MSLSLPVPQKAALELFRTFDRASYKANYTTAAGVFDSTKHIKTWQDDSLAGRAATDKVTYQFYDMTNAQNSQTPPQLSSFTITVKEAMNVNLVGREVVTYEPYVVAPTTAYMQSAFSISVKSSYGPGLLSTKQQADDLAKEVGGTIVEEQGAPGIFFFVYPSDELRRRWLITLPTHNATSTGVWNVGLVMQARNILGIGTPGHWAAAGLAAGNFVWVADTIPDGAGTTDLSWPVPQRLLHADEQWNSMMTILGAMWYIGPKVATPSGGGGTGTGSGLFDAAALKMLQDVNAGVQILLCR